MITTATELTNEADARSRGYEPLTHPFKMREMERPLRDAVLKDLRRDNIPCILVGHDTVHEVWRKGMRKC